MGNTWQRFAPWARRRVPAPLYRLWQRGRIRLAQRGDLTRDGPIVSELRSVLGRDGDLRVLAGPFEGMRYAPASAGSELIPKLLGTYELELHAAVEGLIAAGCPTVVNVGCAEGYYAVGLARRMPDTVVLAYDIDPMARRLCAEMAELNGVASRVEVRSEFVPTDLTPELVARGVAVIIDCEGCEDGLLDPQRWAPLRRVAVLAELHDFVHPGVSDRVRDRFAPSHDVELVAARRRPPASDPRIAALGRRAARIAVDERRPPGMCWAVLVPRDGPISGWPPLRPSTAGA